MLCYILVANIGGGLLTIKQSRGKYNIGRNIRSLRMDNKYTQEQVVAKLQLLGIEMSRGTYSQIECGIANVKVQDLLGMAHIFHCDINAFFKDITLDNE